MVWWDLFCTSDLNAFPAFSVSRPAFCRNCHRLRHAKWPLSPTPRSGQTLSVNTQKRGNGGIASQDHMQLNLHLPEDPKKAVAASAVTGQLRMQLIASTLRLHTAACYHMDKHGIFNLHVASSRVTTKSGPNGIISAVSALAAGFQP